MELTFRAKSLENNKWVKGFFSREIKDNKAIPIIIIEKTDEGNNFLEKYHVDMDTLGQFIGIGDIRNEAIYSNHKVTYTNENGKIYLSCEIKQEFGAYVITNDLLKGSIPIVNMDFENILCENLIVELD